MKSVEITMQGRISERFHDVSERNIISGSLTATQHLKDSQWLFDHLIEYSVTAHIFCQSGETKGSNNMTSQNI